MWSVKVSVDIGGTEVTELFFDIQAFSIDTIGYKMMSCCLRKTMTRVTVVSKLETTILTRMEMETSSKMTSVNIDRTKLHRITFITPAVSIDGVRY